MNIAIKLPNDLRDKILCFPLVHTLIKVLKNNDLEALDDLNVHLISVDENIEVLNLLPIFAYYHEIKKEDLKSIFTIHRACQGLKIDQLDYYISTTESFVDATIGKNLKAKTSIGFDITTNRLFLQKRLPIKSNHTKVEQYLSLTNAFVSRNQIALNPICSRELKPFYHDWNELPYVIINLKYQEMTIWDGWIEFINLFEQTKFVLLLHQNELPNKLEVLQDFIKKLPSTNSYEVLPTSSLLDIAKAMAYAIAVISEDSAMVQLASYCGAKVFHLNEKEDQSKYACGNYFVGAVKTFKFSRATSFNYSFIFDEIYKYIDTRKKDFK